MHTHTRWALFAAVAVVLALGPGVASAATKVETQTITVAPGESGDNSDTQASPGTGIPQDTPGKPTVADDNEPLPTVEYDLAKLPAPVAQLRQKILEAAATGDPEKLRAVIQASGNPQFGPDGSGDPIGYLKLQSGDGEGREMLAILSEVLEAGYVHVDVGTPDEMYLWPYFARYPIDKLTPPHLVELFKLVYAGDYEDMLPDGVYTYFRVGVTPDGKWKYFTDQN
jgi:hypothetical protein